MAIDVKTKHLDSITVAPEFQPAEVSGGVKETLPLVSEGSLSRNEDVLNGGSVNNANLENKRSINELNNAISSICQANNLPLNEIRAMLSLFTRKTEEELLDTIITTQAEINKVVE